MRSMLTAAIALGVVVGTTGLAFAQYYPSPYSYAQPPSYGYYQQPYAGAPYPPGATGYTTEPAWDGTHSSGSGGRAYPWGQKTN